MCFQGDKPFTLGGDACSDAGVLDSCCHTQMSQRQRPEEEEGMQTPTLPADILPAQHREVNRATFLITIAVFHSICKPKLCKVMKQQQSEKRKTIYQVPPLSSAPICTFPGVTAVLLRTEVLLRNNKNIRIQCACNTWLFYFMTHD